ALGVLQGHGGDGPGDHRSRGRAGGGVMSERPIAFVTGGAGGIGAACCRALAQEGFRVGVGYRSSGAAAQALWEEIDGFGVPGDIAVVEDVEKMVATIKDAAGRLDVLVNNAALNVNGPFMMMPLED